MKTCARCQETKPLGDFNRNRSNRDGLQAYCRNCSNGYHRAWLNGTPAEPRSATAQAYLDRKRERARAAARERNLARGRVTLEKRAASSKHFVAAVKLSLACIDCGWAPDASNSARMHFDHRDPGWKASQGRTGRSAFERSWNLGRIAEEILDHCDPRCKPCHAKRTGDQLRAAWEHIHGQR